MQRKSHPRRVLRLVRTRLNPAAHAFAYFDSESFIRRDGLYYISVDVTAVMKNIKRQFKFLKDVL